MFQRGAKVISMQSYVLVYKDEDLWSEEHVVSLRFQPSRLFQLFALLGRLKMSFNGEKPSKKIE